MSIRGAVCSWVEVVKRLTTIVPKQTQKRKRTTLRELAEITGLSTAGASYALRGERVSAETSARVREAAERIGFRSDPIARALRGGSSGMIGVIGGSLADFWHQDFSSEVQRHLRDRDRLMLLADAAGDAATELEVAGGLVDQRVDGLIVLPVDPSSPGWLPIVRAVPTVSVGAPLPAPAGSVGFAAGRGMRMMLEHLRDLGHERILILSTGAHRPPRQPGVRRVTCGYAVEDGRRARRALAGREPPTAVFALSDALAYGAYAACRELGLNVPGQVSVAGFDDHPVSALVEPSLTTVSWDTPRAAEAAVAMLTTAIADATPTGRLLLPPKLIVRGSTAAAAVRG
jgi:LacI family transcriptional regulator, galactose operon repressor